MTQLCYRNFLCIEINNNNIIVTKTINDYNLLSLFERKIKTDMVYEFTCIFVCKYNEDLTNVVYKLLNNRSIRKSALKNHESHYPCIFITIIVKGNVTGSHCIREISLIYKTT